MIRIAAVFVFLSGILLFIFNSAEWHAEEVSLPRYCDNPDLHVLLVGEILSDENTIGTENRRPYIIAAKLIYIIPRQEAEPLESYLARLHQRIRASC